MDVLVVFLSFNELIYSGLCFWFFFLLPYKQLDFLEKTQQAFLLFSLNDPHHYCPIRYRIIHFKMKETRYIRYVAFGLCLFLIVPVLLVGGIFTAILTDSKEAFEVFYHVVFLGVLNGMAFVSFIGTLFRLLELRKFDGNIVHRSLYFKTKELCFEKHGVYHGNFNFIFFLFYFVDNRSKIGSFGY